MSTKIYEAYRVPIPRLNELLAHTRQNVLEHFRKTALAMMDRFKPEWWEERSEELKLSNFKSKRFRKWLILREEFKKASLSLTKSLFDMDFVWNVWIHDDGYAYVIPYGRHPHGAKELGFVEDFSYWDNVDPPEEVPEAEFKARGTKWEEICLHDGDKSWNETRLHHTVIDFSRPASYVDGWIFNKLGRGDSDAN